MLSSAFDGKSHPNLLLAGKALFVVPDTGCRARLLLASACSHRRVRLYGINIKHVSHWHRNCLTAWLVKLHHISLIGSKLKT